jgi:amidohydrolase
VDVDPAEVESLLEAVQPDVLGWRRHLHAHPEVSFHERETAEFVYQTLKRFEGLELTRPTEFSVVARLMGAAPGPVLAMRADIDALPISEENEIEFVSRNPGAMHACGHDAHTAMLLGAVHVLSHLRDRLPGEIRFVFQPAEELPPGGAQPLCDSGALDGVDAVIGAHVWTPLPVGTVAVKSGPMMASSDTFELVIRGRGGHAAQPHMGVDCVAVAAQAIVNLQQIVSRQTDPLKPLVVSITKIHAGTTNNVIPDVAELAGTVRSFDPEQRQAVPGIMERVLRGVTQAHGAEYDLSYQFGYRPVINDPRISAWVEEALLAEFGRDAVVAPEPSMGGEDFSAYLTKAPGTFFLIGAGNAAKGLAYPHHNARFNIDEDALRIGLRAEVHTALHLLERLQAAGR